MHGAGGAVKLLTGNSHPELAQAIAQRLGIPLTRCTVKKFSDNETNVAIHESVRDADIYIIQTGFNPSPYPTNGSVPPTPGIGSAQLNGSAKGSRPTTPVPHRTIEPNGDAPSRPASPGHFRPDLHPFSDPNDLLMELLILISACKTASARRITALIPCYPYSRMDRKDRSRAPITAKLVANMLQIAGADHVITMELHAGQIQGFFDIPCDNLWVEPMMINYIKTRIDDWKNCIIVSPDAGGAKRATSLADRLDVDFALINRRRSKKGSDGKHELGRMEILVGDVKGKASCPRKIAVLLDDMCDTGETLQLAAHTLHDAGAKQIYAVVAHGLLSGSAPEIIKELPLDRLVVTNTISQKEHLKVAGDKIEVIDISPVLAESIRRTHNGESISLIFTEGGISAF
ncbi:phosphoribosyl pyrophosphokinase [Atractiella rhizophila]|nr:phosphoribosyl pyrophosphokinase [Atractiella rhizophila]